MMSPSSLREMTEESWFLGNRWIVLVVPRCTWQPLPPRYLGQANAVVSTWIIHYPLTSRFSGNLFLFNSWVEIAGTRVFYGSMHPYIFISIKICVRECYIFIAWKKRCKHNTDKNEVKNVKNVKIALNRGIRHSRNTTLWVPRKTPLKKEITTLLLCDEEMIVLSKKQAKFKLAVRLCPKPFLFQGSFRTY